MLVESKCLRDLLNPSPAQCPEAVYHHDCDSAIRKPEDSPVSYGFSTNPLPALVVLLLGIIMSAHHQNSEVSTMVHKQWGTLLVGVAAARAVTYVIFYISPPTSLLPSRPPSELIASFCLMAGGLIFMASVCCSPWGTL